MSTPVVRQGIIGAVTAAIGAVPVHDISDYVSLSDLGLNTTEEAVLIDFTASNEQIRSIGGSGNNCHEEFGTVALHWISPQGFDSAPVLNKAELLRLDLRWRRFPGVAVEDVDPFMDSGSPLENMSGWKSYSAYLHYSRRSFG